VFVEHLFLVRTMRSFKEWLPDLKNSLIVSCQALPGEPLFGAQFMSKVALAAQIGGAAGIRANSPEDIRAIRDIVDLPIFGLYKETIPQYEVYITPTFQHALLVAEAGADVICIDATQRPHPGVSSIQELVGSIQTETGCPVLADVSTLEEALRAEDAGSEMVSSTLSGYTPYSRQLDGPDLQLVQEMAARLHIPVFAEGRYHYPYQAAEAIRMGAYAVIVGGAITRPVEITQRFATAIKSVDHFSSSGSESTL
jgi:N-acylglucosamine-6-phosphate 2-epimerase